MWTTMFQISGADLPPLMAMHRVVNNLRTGAIVGIDQLMIKPRACALLECTFLLLKAVKKVIDD